MNIGKGYLPFWGPVLIVVLIWFLITGKFKKPTYISPHEICLKEKRKNFNGRVKKAFYDASNAGAFTVLLRDKKVLLTSLPHYGKSPIKSGDSIVKKSGKSYYLVYKESVADSVIRLDFDCTTK